MEQPRGQQPALLPDQLPDGGRRARLHRGVSARPRGAAAGPGLAVGWPRSGALRPGSVPRERVRPALGGMRESRGGGAAFSLPPFPLFSPYPPPLPFPLPAPPQTPGVVQKYRGLVYSLPRRGDSVAMGFVLCWWGVTGLRAPCALSPFPTGCSSSLCPRRRLRAPRPAEGSDAWGAGCRCWRSRILRSDLCFLLNLPSGAAQAETRSALNFKKCIDKFCPLLLS